MSYILLIDDSADDIAEMTQLMEACASYDFDCASSHTEAIASVRQRVPDLIVVDPNLPAGQSLDFIQTLRKEYPLIPAVIVSSIGEEDAAIQALKEGASSYVPKHLIKEALIPTIKEILALMHQQRCHSRMLQLMTRWDCDFLLENDRALIAPLVAYLQEHLMQLGICDDGDATRMGIALDEALVNALYHGNLELDSALREQDISAYEKLALERARMQPYADRMIEVKVRMTRDEVEVEIADQGPGFDPGQLPDPTDPANIDRVSGRGVLLMRTFMDEVVFDDRGSRVTMRKRASKRS